MYESHFGLSARPFPEVPHADYYFPAESLEQARTAIVRCLTRGAGAALILGAPGTGKSMLCERLAADLQNQFPIANLNWGHPTSRRGLLQAILYKLELPYRNLDEGELRLSFIDHLTRSPNCPQGIVLIVDEAHLMPIDLLEEIRILTNVIANREPRVRLVLAGQIGLEETLAHPRMVSLQQRIAARCQIVNFRREETHAFIRQAIARCSGVPGALIGDRAADMVHDLTHGTPRLINQLCDHALIMACIHGDHSVSADLMHEAWSDLQQLPISLDAYRPTSTPKLHDDIIEFGNLDDNAPFIPFPHAPTDSEPPDTQPSVDLPITAELPTEPVPSEPALAAPLQTAPLPTAPLLPAPLASEFSLFGDHFVEQETVIDRYTEIARNTLRLRAPEPQPQPSDDTAAMEIPSPESVNPPVATSVSKPLSTVPPSTFTIDWTHSIDLSDVAPMLASNDLTAASPAPLNPADGAIASSPLPLPAEPVVGPAEVSDDLPAYELADWDMVAPRTPVSSESAHDIHTESANDLLADVADLLADRSSWDEASEPTTAPRREFVTGIRIMDASVQDPPPASAPKRNLKSLFSQLEAKTTESRA